MAICADCPVREPCIEDALAHRDRYGVSGGLTEAGRRRACADATAPPASVAGRRSWSFRPTVCGRQADPAIRKQAGWGTDHLGWGPCRLHGGSTISRCRHVETLREEGWTRILALTDPALTELAGAAPRRRDQLMATEDVDRDHAARMGWLVTQGGVQNSCPRCGTAMFDRHRVPPDYVTDSALCAANVARLERRFAERDRAGRCPPSGAGCGAVDDGGRSTGRRWPPSPSAVRRCWSTGPRPRC